MVNAHKKTRLRYIIIILWITLASLQDACSCKSAHGLKKQMKADV